ncbi:MarR family winged helix-turn-helix transcriptional regulator [Burkholderia gladioli]|uniref:MarR family winged helix-turn-helix transcriptional regulator n=1 Tax=Burkholderia gladioli TaxID=28095 RepID=UPI00163F7353|nr:MarR family transcriptional regulator [Burkholderia gladioli]
MTEPKLSPAFPAGPISSEIARDCLFTRTRQLSRFLTAIYDDAFRPFGINAPQFSLLVLIVDLGPLTRSNLGRSNQHDRSTLTRNLQPLIAQGWVEETREAGDRRIRLLSLTERGNALLREAASAWQAAQARAKAQLGEHGARALMELAGTLPRRAG